MTYLVLKYLHTIAAVATVSGFTLRGFWMMSGSPRLQHRLTKVVPHVIDTVFFLAAVGMLWIIQLNPFTQSWLLAKFAGLIVYIVLGSIAIKRGSTRQIRIIAFVVALAAFAYVVGVALTKSPLGWMKLM